MHAGLTGACAAASMGTSGGGTCEVTAAWGWGGPGPGLPDLLSLGASSSGPWGQQRRPEALERGGRGSVSGGLGGAGAPGQSPVLKPRGRTRKGPSSGRPAAPPRG